MVFLTIVSLAQLEHTQSDPEPSPMELLGENNKKQGKLSTPASSVVLLLKKVPGDSEHNGKDETQSLRKRRRVLEASDDEQEFWNALKQKAWLSYDGIQNGASAVKQMSAGVIRGCPTCDCCQKVVARWRPGEGRAPSLEEAPVFFPDQEEFEDPLKYISSIRPFAEPYGICRIVPPRSWRPTCNFKDDTVANKLQFDTRVQQVHKLQSRESKAESTKEKGSCVSEASDAYFGFQTGPNMTLSAYKKYADEFKQQYFMREGEEASVARSLEEIEGEYWRVVEKPTEQIEVLYGADLDTAVVGSGFPKAKQDCGKSDPYAKSGWNLNNIARVPGSMLAFETTDIPGVVVPWLYVGMCLSSFCWHVEDHFLYSVNYLHCGDSKIWYGVPRSSWSSLEDIMRKHLPDLFKEQPDLMQKLITQFSPSILKEEGVPVYRAVQRAGDFIITFPRAYHCGLNTGFNCAEAVNFAPIDWLLHGQAAVELYQKIYRKASVSHDKLLLAAVNHYLDNVQNNERADDSRKQAFSEELDMLTKALKARVQTEHSRRLWLGEAVKTKKMDTTFDSIEEKECFHCHFDLHLSAVTCECCTQKYACLEHVNLLCDCPKESKHALYRYDISELYRFQAALEKASGSGPEHEPETDSSESTRSEPLKQPKQEQRCTRSANISVGSPFSQKGSAPRYGTGFPIPNARYRSTIDHVGSSQEPSVTRQLVKNSQCSSENKAQSTPIKSHQEVVVLSDDEGDNPKSVASGVRTVELLDAGTVVQAGWCNQHSIFPAGFKSRVVYYNYLDLPRTAYYVSEIVCCSIEKPYFKVALDGHPNECFINSSIDMCWQAVQERLNFEVQFKRKLGFSNLPPVQPKEKISGLEMFGLSSPSIKQVVEALDYNRSCDEYWAGKSKVDSKVEVNQMLGPYELLRGLFRKGNKDELWMLHRVFGSDWGTHVWKQGFQALADELEKLLEGNITGR